MTLPSITFKEFLKSPITALLFMCIIALGYLHISQTNNFKEQIEHLQSDVETLKKENKELNNKIELLITKL